MLLLILAWTPAAQAWTGLTSDLDAWRAKPDLGHWRLSDGVIRGANGEKKRGSVLWTREEFGDFAFECEFRFDGKIDSGIFVKGTRYQVNLGESSSLKVDRTACIYAPADGKGKYPGMAEGVDNLLKAGEWNRLRVEARGAHIIVMLNGREVLDYQTKEMPASGPIGLQVHQGMRMKIEFRKLRVKDLGDGRVAP